jgi:hypothetical protein
MASTSAAAASWTQALTALPAALRVDFLKGVAADVAAQESLPAQPPFSRA